jgi:hypothetical protein
VDNFVGVKVIIILYRIEIEEQGGSKQTSLMMFLDEIAGLRKIASGGSCGKVQIAEEGEQMQEQCQRRENPLSYLSPADNCPNITSSCWNK